MSAGFGAAPPQMSVDSRVTASGEAQVEQQVGVQFIDSVLHDATIYTTQLGDPPDRLHEVAKAHLEGGNPRRAEEILHGLFIDNHFTTERAYLYVLAVLSDRPFTEVTAELSESIRNAMEFAARSPRDEWRDALDIVDMLLRYAHAEFGEGAVSQEFAAALEGFHSLPANRQDEIDRHLELILSGAVQEKLTEERKHRVAVERMSGDRVRRAWKFFESNPRPPAKWRIPPVHAGTDWRDAVLGSAALALSLVSVFVAGISAGAAVGLGCIAVGACLVLKSSIDQEVPQRHARSLAVNQQMWPYQQETRFDSLVDQCFREGLPRSFWEVTTGYRCYLKRRLQFQYYGVNFYPGELKWLIMWHVMRAGQQFSYPPAQPPKSARASSFLVTGVVIWASGLLVMVAAGHFFAALLSAVGWWGIHGIARIGSTSRVRALLDRDADALFAEEWASYIRWTEVLVDRPSDAEMGRWLALDKAFLKDDALRRANLSERDLVTYVVLTERAPFARKGRVTSGPTRYEKYMVHVFLLTHYGMRTARIHLDLSKGEISNEKRQMCNYDNVASASVSEKGVRTFRTDGRPSVGSRMGRIFKLTLVNGECISEVREYGRFSQDGWSMEDENAAHEASTQTSGFDGALQIFEAVASEGRDWIARDRERKRRWARNWRTTSPSEEETGAGVSSCRKIAG